MINLIIFLINNQTLHVIINKTIMFVLFIIITILHVLFLWLFYIEYPMKIKIIIKKSLEFLYVLTLLFLNQRSDIINMTTLNKLTTLHQ